MRKLSEMLLLLFFSCLLDHFQVSLGPGLSLGKGLRSQEEAAESCYCCSFLARASASWREQTGREREKEEGGGGERAVLKWRILVYTSCATAQRKTPSVSMGTGPTPCSSTAGRGEAGEGRPEQMCYVMCVFCMEITAWINVCLGT